MLRLWRRRPLGSMELRFGATLHFRKFLSLFYSLSRSLSPFTVIITLRFVWMWDDFTQKKNLCGCFFFDSDRFCSIQAKSFAVFFLIFEASRVFPNIQFPSRSRSPSSLFISTKPRYAIKKRLKAWWNETNLWICSDADAFSNDLPVDESSGDGEESAAKMRREEKWKESSKK